MSLVQRIPITSDPVVPTKVLPQTVGFLKVTRNRSRTGVRTQYKVIKPNESSVTFNGDPQLNLPDTFCENCYPEGVIDGRNL